MLRKHVKAIFSLTEAGKH